MLKIEDMHVYYGAIHAIKGVSFEVGEGEIVALIGANGAGKSTILKTVSGLMHPRSGSITFCGENIAHTDAYKLLPKGLAHVPEGRRIFLQMTVQENLEMGAYINLDDATHVEFLQKVVGQVPETVCLRPLKASAFRTQTAWMPLAPLGSPVRLPTAAITTG